MTSARPDAPVVPSRARQRVVWGIRDQRVEATTLIDFRGPTPRPGGGHLPRVNGAKSLWTLLKASEQLRLRVPGRDRDGASEPAAQTAAHYDQYLLEDY